MTKILFVFTLSLWGPLASTKPCACMKAAISWTVHRESEDDGMVALVIQRLMAHSHAHVEAVPVYFIFKAPLTIKMSLVALQRQKYPGARFRK